MRAHGDERGHMTFGVVDPAVVAGRPVEADDGSGLLRPPNPKTTLDRALAAAAEAARLEDLDDLYEDVPTLRGPRPRLVVDYPADVPTMPAAMVRDALLAAARATLADAPPRVTPSWAEDDELTTRGDRRAIDLALRAAEPKRARRTLPPPLPIPLVRRADAWIDELPEAARRVLLEARAARPSWPLVERAEGAVLRPRPRIPSLRPRRES